jgi:hypothetical protein
MTGHETPKFTGISSYRDHLGRFSIRYPTDWHTYEIRQGVSARRGHNRKARRNSPGKGSAPAPRSPTAEDPLPARDGIGFAPDPADPHTSFSAWVSPQGESVVAEDLEVLRSGVDAGLEALDDCRIEHAADDVLSNLVKFERIYTFREGESVRKRKQWLLYVDTWLMCLTWQGSSPEAYHYWYAMANHSFHSFELPQALWFATDRDLAGWRRTAAAAATDSANSSQTAAASNEGT